MKEKKTTKNYDMNVIFGAINSIVILADIEKFKSWLMEEHHISPTDFENNLFIGYRYSIETLIRTLMWWVESENSFGFEEDEYCYRAHYVGINIEKIPNTCDKTKVLKKIYFELKKIENTTNSLQFEKQVKNLQKSILDPFLHIFKNDVKAFNKLNLKKREALRYSSMYVTYIFLNDTQYMEPRGFYVSILNNDKRDQKSLLEGYKYSIQYLWTKLLGEIYKETSINQIHLTKVWAQSFDSYLDQKDTLVKEISFDSYFGIIKREVVEKHIENKMKDIFDPVFLLKKKGPDKQILKRLISNSLPDIELTTQEKVDQLTLWYDKIEMLTSSKLDTFNGVNTFIQLLLGAVEIKKLQGVEEKVYVRKFVHPNMIIKNNGIVKQDQGNDYSYGILIDTFGSFGTDYSGWVIFYDCCTDYSGFGGTEHENAEGIIRLRENEINLDRLTIDKNELYDIFSEKITKRYHEEDEYIEHQMVKYNDFENIKNKYKNLETKFYEAKGMLVELLKYYIESSAIQKLEPREIKIEWD
ncbi:hypothetical protein MsAg5_03610 [Methanosarcinaceae archaeon Ag5]|uniref:Uncharacterized protein n=1 Tax=Methanolapillus africanus TaxID=3028297 RepID=A0AAE4MHY7_9EURY|nr:hypothetical protein [Methanosarcinaceae archaeon Ag5]